MSSFRLTAVMRALQIFLCCCVLVLISGCHSVQPHATGMKRIAVSPDRRGFVFAGTSEPFHPWGMNYGNSGRLMEDFWDGEWGTFEGDFRELKALGANVVRVICSSAGSSKGRTP